MKTETLHVTETEERILNAALKVVNDVTISGENGFVCDNLNEYENVINSISGKKVDINRIQKNVISDIKNNYTITNMCKKYKEIYN